MQLTWCVPLRRVRQSLQASAQYVEASEIRVWQRAPVPVSSVPSQIQAKGSSENACGALAPRSGINFDTS